MASAFSVDWPCESASPVTAFTARLLMRWVAAETLVVSGKPPSDEPAAPARQFHCPLIPNASAPSPLPAQGLLCVPSGTQYSCPSCSAGNCAKGILTIRGAIVLAPDR